MVSTNALPMGPIANLLGRGTPPSCPDRQNLPMDRRLLIAATVLVLHLLALWALHAGLLHRPVEQVIPVQVLAEPPGPGEVFRIGGLVEEGTLVRGQGETITFNVTDGAASVPVSYTGVLPDLFKEGEGMVGTGRLVNGVFEASEILAKHDETYMPAEVIDALKEQGVYVDPNG